jgi:F0F1-type ATP synthase epsilon subunit
MERPFHFQIETPSGIFIEGDDITAVIVTTPMGQLEVLAKHEPIVAACAPGIVKIRQGEEWMNFRTSRAILVSDGINVKLITSLVRLAI